MGSDHVECVLAAAWLLDVALEEATHPKRKAKGTECSLRLWWQLQIYSTFLKQQSKNK